MTGVNHWIITANRLTDGSVTYLRADRSWAGSIDDAWVARSRAQAEPLVEWARGRERDVCDPYLVEVDLSEGRPLPRSARERIRAEGPAPTLRRLGYGASALRRAG